MTDNTKDFIQSDEIIVLEDKQADQHDEALVMDENTIILAAGDAYSLIDMTALIKAMHDAGMTYHDISEQKDISLSAVYKFFRKRSKNPSFYNVVQIIEACGASVDEICGIKRKDPDSAINRLCEIVEAQSRKIDELTRELRRIAPANTEDY